MGSPSHDDRSGDEGTEAAMTQRILGGLRGVRRVASLATILVLGGLSGRVLVGCGESVDEAPSQSQFPSGGATSGAGGAYATGPGQGDGGDDDDLFDGGI